MRDQDIRDKIALYLRVSTEEQALEGYSLFTQDRECTKKTLELGSALEDIKVYTDDGYSGEFLDRPAMNTLRDDLKIKKFKYVIFYDLDRMARDLHHQLLIADEIEKSGAELIFVRENFEKTPEGRLFFNMRGAIAQYEKEKIRERTMRGKQGKALKGKIIQNAAPFGFDWDSTNSVYVINEEEAEVIRHIYSLCVDHKMGIHGIYLELKRQGVVVKRKNAKRKPDSNEEVKIPRTIHPKTIHNILTKKMYCGIYEQFRTVSKQIAQKKRKTKKNDEDKKVIIKIPAIISEEIFQAAQEQLESNRVLGKRKTTTKKEYLLSGFIFCPDCNRRLIGSELVGKRKNGREVIYQYYFCVSKISSAYRSETDCTARRVVASELDQAVWDIIVDISKGSKSLDAYIKKQETRDVDAELTELNKQKVNTEEMKDTIFDWLRSGQYTNDKAKKAMREADNELSRINSEIIRVSRQKSKLKPLPMNDILNAATFEQKRSIITSLGIKIYAKKDTENQVEFWFEEY